MPEFRIEQAGDLRVERREDVPLKDVLAALRSPGEVLKQSHKACTRRVCDWVIKESRHTFGERIKHALQPGKYRRGWLAARALAERGIGAPMPVAYAERRRMGLTVGNAVVLEYLDGFVSVEEFARRLVAAGASTGRVASYLEALSKAVGEMIAAGAYHTDLSGKNVFTRTGGEFRFIDLDGVVLDRPYTEAVCMLNHVQLYDSFCDLWDDSLLQSFLTPLIPADRGIEGWMEDVRANQAQRRARTEAIWRREGRFTA